MLFEMWLAEDVDLSYLPVHTLSLYFQDDTKDLLLSIQTGREY